MIFTSDRAKDRFKDLKPTSRMILEDMDNWTQKYYGVELTITETVTTLEEDKELKRESATHREGRAWDIRTIGMPDGWKEEFKKVFNKKYNFKCGAINSNGPSLIVDKPHGTGPHLHCQIRR